MTSGISDGQTTFLSGRRWPRGRSYPEILNKKNRILRTLQSLNCQLSYSNNLSWLICIGFDDGQTTILRDRRRLKGESYSRNLERWRKWRWNFVRKYWNLIEVCRGYVLACLYVNQARECRGVLRILRFLVTSHYTKIYMSFTDAWDSIRSSKMKIRLSSQLLGDHSINSWPCLLDSVMHLRPCRIW